MHYHRHRFRRFLRGDGIEIGALNNPMQVPAGVRMRYADVLTPQQIEELYPGSKCPDIIISNERLPQVSTGSTDFIIANHVIEHVSDPIGVLKEWHRTLRPGGYLLMCIPDKRYTFDSDRSRTTLAHLIEDFESQIEPRIRDRMHLEDWATHVEKIPQNSPQWKQWVEKQFTQGYSVHNHVWILEDIIELLLFASNNLKISFDIVDVRNTPPGDLEFLVILQASPKGFARLRNHVFFAWAIRREQFLRWLRTKTLLYLFARKIKMTWSCFFGSQQASQQF